MPSFLSTLSLLAGLAALVKSIFERRHPGHFPLLDLLRETFARPANPFWSCSLAFAAGVLVVLLPFLASIASGWAEVRPNFPPVTAAALALALLTILVKFLLAGIEELIYRGALLVQLSRLLPLAIALLLSSALFALAHSGRAVAPDTLSVAVYLLDGLAFGLAFWLTRSLWPPTLWHFSKNLSIWLLYSRSTLQFSPGLLQARLITPSIWTGAEGQAGLLDLFVTSAVLAALLLIARLHGVRRGA